MCGIFALIGYNGESTNVNVNFASGTKRGPEHSELKKLNDTVYFGFHRLAINGLKLGNQPLYYKHFVLICNGEIYNYKELIAKYDLKVTTGSDCEVIVHLYDLLGENFINELDGEFAFLLFNTQNNSTFIARDPYGVRPLYMNNVGNTFCFASDIEPMKCMSLSNITHFKPGTFMVISRGVNYYIQDSVKYHSIVRNTIGDYRQGLYDVLHKVVLKRVTNTERPVACLLSGGLDSSLVAAIAAKHFAKKGIQLETYSIGLSGSEDLKYAAIVAKHINSKHTEIICTESQFFDSIPQVIKDIESYDTTSVRASVGNWNIGKYIKEHSDAKVVLNGDGADELMGGYLYFKKAPNAFEFDKECKRLLQDIYMFDVLRSDKSISSHGLEPRTPFLDRSWVEFYLSIDKELRYNTTKNECEKYLIRKSVEVVDPLLLPREILWRTKEAFSDGVSSLNKSWYKIIQEKIEKLDIDLLEHDLSDIDLFDLTINLTPEQKYYKSLFNKDYKDCEHLIEYLWMPKYVNAKDASARTLNCYNENNTNKI